MEIAIILSIVSIVFSVISLTFTFLRFGINITQEFCERPDVIERKEKLETAYKERLNEDWRVLINAHPEKGKLGDEAIGAFTQFWMDAPLSYLPTMIIAQISSFTEEMITDFILIIGAIVGFAATYLLNIYYPSIFEIYQIKGITIMLFLMSLLFLYRGLKDMKNMIPGIIELRRQFFNLSESAELEELQKVMDELNDKDLL